jgi:hypothetical protein
VLADFGSIFKYQTTHRLGFTFQPDLPSGTSFPKYNLKNKWKMSDDSYMYLSEIIYQSKSFRDLLINTKPLWSIFCNIMVWVSPIFLAAFVRPGCLSSLLGVCVFTFFIYIETTSRCFISGNSCNVNDNSISIYYDIVIGAAYSTVATFFYQTNSFWNRRISFSEKN